MEYVKDEADTSAVYHPLDPGGFSVPAARPTLAVSVASVRAQCRAATGCAYAATAALTPTISSASVSSLQVTVAGSGLGAAEEGTAGEGWLPAVSIGGVPCEVSQRSDTSIVCDLPHPLRPGSNSVKVRS